MSTVAEPPTSEQRTNPALTEASPGNRSDGPDLSRLEDRTPNRLRLSRAAAGWTALLGVLYLVLSYQPLYHTDLWGHLAYGRWIWEHGSLPATEPLLPLCEGVPMVDTAWLSQLIGFEMYQRYGVTAMQLLYAVPITLSFGLLLWGVLHRTRGSVLAGLISLGVFGWVDYQQLLIVRPQLAGLTLFVALFLLTNVCRWRWGYWIVVPALFALWANLHGSWIVGLGLLGALCIGRAIDVARRTKSLKSPLADLRVRRLLVLTELSALAVLLNPYGLGLYAEVLAISGNPNVQDLIEWEPLTLRMSQGRAAAAAALALVFMYRFSPRRVSAAEVLLLGGLGGAALWSSRMIHWWAPLAAYYLSLHAAAIWRSRHRRPHTETRRSGLMSVITVGLIWIFFSYTPFGLTLLHGRPQDAAEQANQFRNSTSAATPITAVEYLREHPVQGLVLNSYEWGDFLLFAGPPDLKVFTNSHAHLIPREVWEDSIQIQEAAGGWDDKLDRYGVNAVVVNVQTDAPLVKALKGKAETWDVALEDKTTAIFRRKKEI